MSMCFRALSCKLMYFAGQRNQIMQLDYRLTRFINTFSRFQENNQILSKQIINEESLLTPSVYKPIHFKCMEVRLYSTSLQSSKKVIKTSDEYSKVEVEKSYDKKDRKSEEQLDHVYKTLANNLPRIFVTSIDFRIYHKDLEFINNYKGVETKGIHAYIKQILILRVLGHLTYAYVKFDVLKITKHPEDNTVKVRWRIRGLSTLKVFTQFWKLKLSDFSKSLENLETWHDAFSTYYVNSDGLVYKHVVDKVMPDNDTIVAKGKPNIAAKFAA